MSSERSIAFVASGQIPPSAPPANLTGPIGWVKENLFDGVTNSILTVVSILVIVLLVPPIIDWAFLKGVWNATSLGNCREIVAATHGEGASGACWAVINERFNQFLFGFYPPELYWRPILTFVLLFVAIAPVLFSSLPRQMLWFSLAFPLVAVFLIWGGSIWGTLVFLAGPVVGYLLGFRAGRFAYGDNFLAGAAVAVLAIVLWWLFAVTPITDLLNSRIGFVGFEPVESSRLGGFLLSITIGVTGIVGSLPLGIMLALGRQSSMFAIKTMCVVFIEFIRGVPLITLLFVASVLLNYFLPPGTSFDLILRVVIMVTLFASAYMAEVIRGGLAALPSGQYEAADALGLNYWKATQLIIMPQALKVAIPGIVSNFIGLFKDTTLVSVIGLLDPVGLLNPIRATQEWNGILWELYVFVALFFWVFCFSMSRYSMYLERKLKTDR
jgi:general L-amino acid transport system permease protein